jgi:hypothetical protein
MSKPYNEQPDLDLVAKYFVARSLSAERFSDTEKTGKTPDFRIRQGGLLVAYCEVKAPNDPWLDEQLDDAPPLSIVGGCRPDPTFNRLGRLLRKADAQFSAVNADRAALNIVAYVNHDGGIHFGDLVETLTGYFHASDGTKHLTMSSIAEGQIGYEKRRIDCFLWFDPNSQHMPSAVLNESDDERLLRLCALLGFDPKNIER